MPRLAVPRLAIPALAVVASAAALAGCATTDGYASACERDYARNRELSIGTSAALGSAIGAAVAGEGNRQQGAAIGALAGALVGQQLSERDDPCGYGFGGYNRDGRYGYHRVVRSDYRYGSPY